MLFYIHCNLSITALYCQNFPKPILIFQNVSKPSTTKYGNMISHVHLFNIFTFFKYFESIIIEKKSN